MIANIWYYLPFVGKIEQLLSLSVNIRTMLECNFEHGYIDWFFFEFKACNWP